MRVVQIEPGPIPTLTPSAPAAHQGLRGLGGRDVACDHLLLLAPFGFDALDGGDDALRMSVRRIDDHQVDARLAQRRYAIHGVGGGPYGGADTQPAGLILARAREFRRLLEVLHRDHAGELVIAVDDQHLLDAVLVQQRQHLFLGCGLAHGDQPILRRHDRGDRRIELLLEPQVAVRDDADRLPADDHRHAGDAARAREVEHLADGRIGGDGDRVLDDAALELLHAADLAGLRLDGHALVNDADAAFLRDGDGEAGFGDRVHGGREQGEVEPNAAGDARRQVDFPGQYFRVGRDEEDVVEGEGFFEDSHS